MRTVTTFINVAISVTALTLCSGGCATAHALPAIAAAHAVLGLAEETERTEELREAMTDREIANLLDLEVILKLPTTLSIARLTTDRWSCEPSLAVMDSEEIKQWENLIDQHAAITGMRTVTPLCLGTKPLSLRSLRTAAAKLGSELLLVYVQGDSQVENFNDAAVLYWTFVGLWVVPGTTLEHKTVIHALLVEPRTGAILATACGESHHKKICPAAFTGIHEPKLAARTPREALADLQEACRPLLADVVSRSGEMAARRQ